MVDKEGNADAEDKEDAADIVRQPIGLSKDKTGASRDAADREGGRGGWCNGRGTIHSYNKCGHSVKEHTTMQHVWSSSTTRGTLRQQQSRT